MFSTGHVREPRTPLTRASDDRLLAGVCGGLAVHLGVPPLYVRIGMVLCLLAGGAGGLFYLWLWGTVPLEGESRTMVPLRQALTKPAAGQVPGTAPFVAGSRSAPASSAGSGAGASDQAATRAAGSDQTPRTTTSAASTGSTGSAGSEKSQDGRSNSRARLPIAELLFGTCLLVVGVLLVVQRLGGELRLSVILPGLAVLVGVGLTWWQIADRDRPETHMVPRVLGALALVAVGTLMFFVTAEEPSVWTVIGAAIAVLAGVSLAIAPWLLRLNRELIAERAGREREAERSEIAAHLHDSVLQTLALIQQRSEPGSDVARIARGQERELRDWLFRSGDGGAVQKQTALAELRTHAAALEDVHAVRFETVGVGAEVSVPKPIVDAAKEAMLNAARHAGGDVTVFAEVTPNRVSIDVTDRGPGLELSAIPEGRMGVRESILGRMDRAGGTARIVPGPGGRGTSVRLEIPREIAPNTTAAPAASAGGAADPAAAASESSAAGTASAANVVPGPSDGSPVDPTEQEGSA